MLPTPLGRVASLYYLQHTTAALIAERFRGRQLTHTEVCKGACKGLNKGVHSTASLQANCASWVFKILLVFCYAA